MLLKCEGADSFNDLRLFIAVLVSKGIPRETVIVLANRYCVGATPDVTALGADECLPRSGLPKLMQPTATDETFNPVLPSDL